MNFKEIETIVTIYKNKSFYETAFALNYAPSTISKYVSSVEEELGVTLFVRGNRPSSVALTNEGEVLIPKFVELFNVYSQIQGEASHLKNIMENQIAIGTGSQLRTIGADEIMSGFGSTYPDIFIKHIKCNSAALIQYLLAKQLDGAFVMVIEGSPLEKSLLLSLEDPRIDVQILYREKNMYMGISEMDPVSRLDEAPITAFNGYSVIVNSDRELMNEAGTLEPFLQLREKTGFDFTPLFIDTRDASAYYMATQSKVAAPAPSNRVKYPGIKFVRVTDWDLHFTSYFLTLKSNRREAVTLFKNCVSEFALNNNLT